MARRSSKPLPFSVSVEHEDGVPIVVVDGELDLQHSVAFHAALDEAADGARAIVVDLCDCAFMDSTGLSALLVARRRMGPGGLVVCRRDGGAVARLLDLTLAGHVPSASSREAALAGL